MQKPHAVQKLRIGPLPSSPAPTPKRHTQHGGPPRHRRPRAATSAGTREEAQGICLRVFCLNLVESYSGHLSLRRGLYKLEARRVRVSKKVRIFDLGKSPATRGLRTRYLPYVLSR